MARHLFGKSIQSRKEKRQQRLRLYGKIVKVDNLASLTEFERLQLLKETRRRGRIRGLTQNSSIANGQRILRDIDSFDMRKAAIEAGVISKTGELTKNYA